MKITSSYIKIDADPAGISKMYTTRKLVNAVNTKYPRSDMYKMMSHNFLTTMNKIIINRLMT